MEIRDIECKHRIIKQKFRVYRKVQPKQRPKFSSRNGFTQAYTPKETLDYENLIALTYQQECDVYFGALPLSVEIRVAFANTEKSNFANEFNQNEDYTYAFAYSPNKKDLDNIFKSVLDGLNKIAYADDSCITSLSGQKGSSVNGQEFIEVTITAYESRLDYDMACIYNKAKDTEKRLLKTIDKLKACKQVDNKGNITKTFTDLQNRYDKERKTLDELVEKFYTQHTKFFEEYGEELDGDDLYQSLINTQQKII